MVNDESSIKLDNLLPAIDKKNYTWWETLSKPQQDKFSSWLYMRYASSVVGDPDLMRYYLMSVNLHVNKRFSSIRNHPKLLYLLMVAASPGLGTVKHNFIPPAKKGKGNKRVAAFAKLYPALKEDELELLAEINTDEDLHEHLQTVGYSDKEIKAFFKDISE